MSLLALEFEAARRRWERIAGRALSWEEESDLMLWAATWEARNPSWAQRSSTAPVGVGEQSASVRSEEAR